MAGSVVFSISAYHQNEFIRMYESQGEKCKVCENVTSVENILILRSNLIRAVFTYFIYSEC